MKYLELKEKHEKEFAAFPMFFAFNDQQFAEGLKKLDCAKSEVVHTYGGGYVRLYDKPKLFALMDRQAVELEKAMKCDEFMLDALTFELNNHEYSISGDPSDTLKCLDLSLEDARVSRIFDQAVKQMFRDEMTAEEAIELERELFAAEIERESAAIDEAYKTRVCNACNEVFDSGGIIALDGSALCAECRRRIIACEDGSYICGNCECRFSPAAFAASGALKCPACDYVDGAELFKITI